MYFVRFLWIIPWERFSFGKLCFLNPNSSGEMGSVFIFFKRRHIYADIFLIKMIIIRQARPEGFRPACLLFKKRRKADKNAFSIPS